MQLGYCQLHVLRGTVHALQEVYVVEDDVVSEVAVDIASQKEGKAVLRLGSQAELNDGPNMPLRGRS